MKPVVIARILRTPDFVLQSQKHNRRIAERESFHGPHATSRQHYAQLLMTLCLILALSGQSTMCEPMWVTDQWLVGYDLKNRKFFLTDDLIEKNERRIYPVVHPISETAADLR